MEGLVKGLMNGVLDAVAGDEDAVAGDEDAAAAARIQSSPADERSRSTWAEVVSSGREEEHERVPEGDCGYGRNQRIARKEESQMQNDGEWMVVGVKNKKHQQTTPRRPHKAVMKFWGVYKLPPNEQEYINEANNGMGLEPIREELDNLSKACSRLWELDLNRLVPGKDYDIDCGQGKKVYQKGDMASKSLFSWISEDIFMRPTYSRFCSLLDNYNPHVGCKEVVTSEEKHEQAAFIEEISRTAPIKYLYHYLVAKDIISNDYEDFKRMMSDLWFNLYGRGGHSSCSSAFEHVFVGEIKGREEYEVSGFHNWIQFYLEEWKERLDYQGYIFPKKRGDSPDSETQLLTIQFEWNGVLKSVSSTLIGVSPEFEIALYTLCFFVGEEENHVCLGPYSVNIKCYRLGKNKIGSVFPVAEI
ncbi:hypothetical protein OPV22_004195 [Ensete ventricosum]|uniref:EndoU domain-containing protein n=1 Tax=Ensete ventricosum TaxID=4639 RepID=A0AAV8S310_ENSVE|nr:hypothetical protein OPV22_004195 [Ensete ventricosum]